MAVLHFYHLHLCCSRMPRLLTREQHTGAYILVRCTRSQLTDPSPSVRCHLYLFSLRSSCTSSLARCLVALLVALLVLHATLPRRGSGCAAAHRWLALSRYHIARCVSVRVMSEVRVRRARQDTCLHLVLQHAAAASQRDNAHAHSRAV